MLDEKFRHAALRNIQCIIAPIEPDFLDLIFYHSQRIMSPYT